MATKEKLPSYANNKVMVKIPTGKRTADNKVEKKDTPITSIQNGTTRLDDAVDVILNHLAVTHTVTGSGAKAKDVFSLNLDSNYAMMKILTRGGDHCTRKSHLVRCLAIISGALTCYKNEGVKMHGKDNGAVGAVAKASGGSVKKFSDTSRR